MTFQLSRAVVRCARFLPWLAAGFPVFAAAREHPFSPSLRLVGTDAEERTAILEGRFPAGFRHVILEESTALGTGWEPMVSGPLTGAEATVTFRCPARSDKSFFRVRAGTSVEVPAAAGSGPEMLSVVYEDAGNFINTFDETSHVLNRIAYGPSPEDFAHVSAIGASAYIEEQLDPGSIEDASGDGALQEAFTHLFLQYIPSSGTPLLSWNTPSRYFKGTSEPPAGWKDRTFDDSSWLAGATGIGYGDDDDVTELTDMREQSDPPQPGYFSVYVRQEFTLTDPSEVETLLLEMSYDDSFVAYLNGTEIARENVEGSPPAFDTPAASAGGNVDRNLSGTFDITAAKSALVAGVNVLAVQGHNFSLDSSDFSLSPAVYSASDPEFPMVASVNNLKHMLHLRGVHSKRQLQAVLAEFWENHFTTDCDKVQDYLENRGEYRNAARVSDEAERRMRDQTQFEAATIDYREYEFFHENALGYFGDLLLYSATSPSMLVYLDSVENTAEEPNENYAREILELSAFGVDNRYTQEDIVELAKCFTGWTIRKIRPGDLPAFPESALAPPTTSSMSVASVTQLVDLGSMWSYFKGTSEPPADWFEPEFSDAAWTSAPAGIGYESKMDEEEAIANLATFLSDMRQTDDNPEGYATVYLRKTLVLPDLAATDGEIAIDVTYDDGFILYLNGTEIHRSRSMRNNSERPAFDETSAYGHEQSAGTDTINLRGLPSFNPGGSNTIAIQAHNSNLTSSDFSILPRVLQVTYSSDSIDPTSTEGVWTFRFDPENHNTEAKVLFPGTPHQIMIPEGRDGPGGIRDALDVIDAIVSHPSTAEFVSVKLVNRFVSDGISLDTYHSRTAPDHLLGLVDQCVHAWTSTARPGHIPTIMRVILDPTFKNSPFWSEGAFLTKAKTPIEFANSSVRALGGSVLDDSRMRVVIGRQGQDFFTRDDPDGSSELGIDWIDTLGFLERMRQAQLLGENSGASYASWPLTDFAADPELQTIGQILDYFDTLVFGGRFSVERRETIKEFANTRYEGTDGNVTSSLSPFDELTGGARTNRLRLVISLILSAPEFYLQ